MSLVSRLSSLVRSAARSPAVRRGARNLGRSAVRAVKEQRRSSSSDSGARTTDEGTHALSDRRSEAPPVLDYAPRQDDRPDPGEVVWAWVPYEEDITRGKDRPVLVIAEESAGAGGADGSDPVLVALMLTSRDRTAPGAVATDEHGSTWVDIGAGNWDREGRPSEVRADRLLRLSPDSVRREGGHLDRERYDRVAAAVKDVHGWR